jgi:DNA-binding MurR/RpiR family transcriptional regulator
MEAATIEHDTRSIRQHVETCLGALSKKQRMVGEFLLAHPTAMLFATATHVAEQAGVDPATVVRFTQSLGFAGYTDFQDALRAESPVLRSALDRLNANAPEEHPSENGGIVAQVRTQTLANVTTTFDRLDEGAIATAIDHLLAAERVVVVGAGQSHSLALHLHRTLQIAQLTSYLMADWYDLLFDAANFSASDALVGVTVWKYSRVTVEALRLANSVGAKGILLTDAPFAPGADVADITLLFEPQALGEYLSPVAGAAIIDCLAAGLAARVPDRVKRGMALQFELGLAQGITYR